MAMKSMFGWFEGAAKVEIALWRPQRTAVPIPNLFRKSRRFIYFTPSMRI
jgi:hypothetical protein